MTVPRIDRPCPLPLRALPTAGGLFAACATHVHALDSLSPEQRRSLLASASGALCVTYSVRRRAARALALAGAAAVLTSGAAQTRADETPPPAGESVQTERPPAAAEPRPYGIEEITVLAGAVSDPSRAAWIEPADADAPELPVHDASALLPDSPPVHSSVSGTHPEHE